MKQKQALDILKLGYNIYLTGAAGSGKTFLLNQYIEYLKKNKIPVAVTASTGIAATHMNGRTIHSWCGMGIDLTMTKSQIKELANKDYLYKNINKTKVLIIDEVSMLHASQLDLVNTICKSLRHNDRPFGGLQVVLCGDFFQLPPVSQGNQVSQFVTASEIWHNMNLHVCYLSEQHRQKDNNFLKVLHDIRGNIANQETLKLLQKRINASIKTKLQVTKLYSHNFNVDQINEAELDKINKKARVYEMCSDGIGVMIKSLKKSCLAPEQLILKKGAIVMFVKNNYLEGYVNGTLGKVINFEKDTGYPIVKILSGEKITVHPVAWRIEEQDNMLAEIRQIPLRLAWAITIHKSQGMSLDLAEIDLSKSFVCGMGYVALSRVKSLSGIVLRGLNNMALKVDPNVLVMDKDLLSLSENTLNEFNGLFKKEINKNQQDFLENNEEVFDSYDLEDPEEDVIYIEDFEL